MNPIDKHTNKKNGEDWSSLAWPSFSNNTYINRVHI